MGNRQRARRIGRRVGTITFAAVVSAFTLVCSVQILKQVFAPAFSVPQLECREAVQALLGAVRRARSAAADSTGDERAALHRFRTALNPEWEWRGALDDSCEGDSEALRALRQIDQLRYAEEHAVRYEAVGVAGLRRRVRSIDLDLPPGK